MALVEDGPQVTKGLVVPPVADGGRAARKVRRREQRATLHRLERPLRAAATTASIVLLCPAQRGDQRARSTRP